MIDLACAIAPAYGLRNSINKDTKMCVNEVQEQSSIIQFEGSMLHEERRVGKRKFQPTPMLQPPCAKQILTPAGQSNDQISTFMYGDSISRLPMPDFFLLSLHTDFPPPASSKIDDYNSYLQLLQTFRCYSQFYLLSFAP